MTLAMNELGRGALSKMAVRLGETAQYAFRLDEQEIAVNPLLGKRIRLEFLGAINCSHCGRKTKKSFAQGYCYPCFTKLAQCDSCIMSPERCHFDAGTCREPSWGEQFCMTDHVVYLANSSGIKVGITRASQIPTRWLDQGASQALPIFRVATRQQSGFVEDLLRSQVADKTNWRALLKGDAAPVDLPAERDALMSSCAEGIAALQQRFGLQAIQIDVEQHDDKKEQHHYCTDINQNQGNRKKLCLQQYPDSACTEESKNQMQGRMNRIAQSHDT